MDFIESTPSNGWRDEYDKDIGFLVQERIEHINPIQENTDFSYLW